MSSGKFSPLVTALKSRFHAILIMVALILLFDLSKGSPLINGLVRGIFTLLNIPRDGIYYTLFGPFEGTVALAAFIDKWVAVACLVIAGINYLKGLVNSLLKNY